MPAANYYRSQDGYYRREAISLILQLWRKYSGSDKRDALVPYLAMTYYDRIMSNGLLPNVRHSKRDNLVLLAISCLTCAWRIRSKSFSINDFKMRTNLRYKYKDYITDMQRKFARKLDCQLCTIVGIGFVPFFLEKSPVRGIGRKLVNQIIIEAQGDITFTQFKHSVIAAAAVVLVCGVLIRDQNFEEPAYKNCIGSFIEAGYVDKMDVDRCCEMLVHMCLKKNMYPERSDKLNRMRAGFVAAGPSQLAPSSYAGEASSSSSLRPGNEPEHDIPETKDEPEAESTEKLMNLTCVGYVAAGPSQFAPTSPAGEESSLSRRPGKEPAQEEIPDIQEETDVEDGSVLEFDLLWEIDIGDVYVDIDFYVDDTDAPQDPFAQQDPFAPEDPHARRDENIDCFQFFYNFVAARFRFFVNVVWLIVACICHI